MSFVLKLPSRSVNFPGERGCVDIMSDPGARVVGKWQLLPGNTHIEVGGAGHVVRWEGTPMIVLLLDAPIKEWVDTYAPEAEFKLMVDHDANPLMRGLAGEPVVPCIEFTTEAERLAFSLKWLS